MNHKPPKQRSGDSAPRMSPTDRKNAANGDRNDSGRVVQKLWSYCHVLRDDGLSYQDYLEQLTQLLFLKMADERAQMTGQEQPIPRGYRWGDLARPDMEGARLEDHYRKTLQ